LTTVGCRSADGGRIARLWKMKIESGSAPAVQPAWGLAEAGAGRDRKRRP
jgi:hypothetical protein